MVAVSERDPRQATGASPEQLRYARVLDVGMKGGLAILIAAFLTYVTGIVPPAVPVEELPRLWSLPLAEYLQSTGMSTGWSWIFQLGKGDMLALVGITVLSGVSAPCLIVLAVAFAKRRDRAYLAITLLVVCVLVLAASGVLTAGH